MKRSHGSKSKLSRRLRHQNSSYSCNLKPTRTDLLSYPINNSKRYRRTSTCQSTLRQLFIWPTSNRKPGYYPHNGDKNHIFKLYLAAMHGSPDFLIQFSVKLFLLRSVIWLTYHGCFSVQVMGLLPCCFFQSIKDLIQ